MRGGSYFWPRVSPDGDAGVVGDAARHDGLGPLDDALVLRRPGDAGASCGHTSRHCGMNASSGILTSALSFAPFYQHQDIKSKSLTS